MPGGTQGNIGANQNVLSNCNFPIIDQGQIHVGISSGTDADILTNRNSKRRVQPDILPYFPKNIMKQ
ncbi:MAG: hypothetical protein ACI4DX_02200, partial [Oliverpabstia sp.]